MNHTNHSSDNYTDIEPFGRVLAQVGKKTRNTFIGKENDKESELGDFGVRKFSDETGRFTSIDPLFEKYYNWSPYVYCFNNPIIAKDNNGKDAVAVVQNNTITVTATYIVDNYSQSEIHAMSQEINGYLNGQNYKVTEGDYSGKDVKFNLQFVQKDESNFSMQSEINGKSIENNFTKASPYDASNASGLLKESYRTQPGQSSFQTLNKGGVTTENNSIIMNKFQDNLRNRIHEIFHTFFFDNDDAQSGIGSYKKQDMPNQKDINTLINNNDLPKINP
ncbi:MAG: RHS repeat-associated core domain-containing protein [Bacteroidota bacterium]